MFLVLGLYGSIYIYIYISIVIDIYGSCIYDVYMGLHRHFRLFIY